MGYVDRNLIAGERVVCRGTVSAWAFVLPSFLVIIGTLGALFIVGIPLLALGIWYMIVAASMEIAVTDRRIIGKSGVISTRSIDLLLDKVESVSTHQSFGAVFNYGTVRVTGSGGAAASFPGVRKPEDLRSAFVRAAESRRVSTTQSSPATGTDSKGVGGAMFEVQIVDRRSGEARWVPVRASSEVEAKQKASATGQIVGDCRLTMID